MGVLGTYASRDVQKRCVLIMVPPIFRPDGPMSAVPHHEAILVKNRDFLDFRDFQEILKFCKIFMIQMGSAAVLHDL